MTIAGALHEYEQQLSGLFAAGGRLSLAVSEAQEVMVDRLGYIGGHQAIAAFADAQAHVARSMASTAEGHRKLSRIGATLGYNFDDFGDGGKDPQSMMRLLLAAATSGQANSAS